MIPPIIYPGTSHAEQTLRALPLQPGERERHMQIELSCHYYAKGWLTLGQAAHMAGLDQFAFGCELAERDIPRNYSIEDALHDIEDARRQ
jgi:predicted HTH domain antitoxin